MEGQHVVFWLCILSSVLVKGEVVYLSQARNDSIELACVSMESSPYAFYLRRKWLQPNKEVLFVHQGLLPTFTIKDDSSRIRVVEGLHAGQVNVTISRLRGSDTDHYICEFVFASNPTDRQEPGRDHFLLYVADHIEQQPCTCSSYPILLYAISGAVGLLLIIVLCLTVAYCGKARNGSKPQPPPVPIYEEMAGLQSGNCKTFCDLSGGFGESEYVRPRRENTYSNP